MTHHVKTLDTQYRLTRMSKDADADRLRNPSSGSAVVTAADIRGQLCYINEQVEHLCPWIHHPRTELERAYSDLHKRACEQAAGLVAPSKSLPPDHWAVQAAQAKALGAADDNAFASPESEYSQQNAANIREALDELNQQIAEAYPEEVKYSTQHRFACDQVAGRYKQRPPKAP